MQRCVRTSHHHEEKQKKKPSPAASVEAASSPEAAATMLTYPESTDSRRRRFPNRLIWSYVAPVFLSPMLAMSDNQGAMRYVYCACLMAVYWLLESVPFVATSLLPLLMLPVLNVMPPGDVASGYVSEPVLSLFLGLSFALALRHGTSLYTRASFALLQGFGTRVRSLMLGFLGCTLLLTQALGASLTAVLMVYTVECAMAEVQNDVIREEQFKLLYRRPAMKTDTASWRPGRCPSHVPSPWRSTVHRIRSRRRKEVRLHIA
ncbi:Na(+)/citrate cotransporter-like [Dermacentor andersoni]|uniref:Na(+)/citrate cotransporter-like n=1 Tax=Dermacentor andersoni TaxID=34620 RepID=UPI002415EE1B|nr:Na(+)/citrate cotransporter-like [Dermacentor andersoni]